MKTLFLTQILPYPPNAGPRVKTWYVLQHLSRKSNQIHLFTFIREEEIPFLPKVESICEEVTPIPIKRNRIKDSFYFVESLIKNSSFLVTRDQSKFMKQRIKESILKQPYDVIHADQLTMAQFAIYAKEVHLNTYPDREPPTTIFDAHNATWTIMDRMRSQVSFYARPIVHRETRLIKIYEGQLIQKFDHTLTVTEIDKNAFLGTIPEAKDLEPKLKVIPIAVDTDDLVPVNRDIDSQEIITLGTLHYPPNADGIRWFMKDVFPLVLQNNPQAKLTIIGKNPPKDFFQFQEHHREKIQITGYVDQLEPYLEKAALIVVPVLAGGGMRVRILEAFSRQIPVVTTTIGLEGINAVHEKDVLVADTPEQFAKETLKLLENPELRKMIAVNGRNLVKEKYDWNTVFTEIDSIYY